MKQHTRRLAPRGGFTLVELIVVLVILSLLLAMVVPSMTGWITRAKRSQAETDCRACVVAAQTIAVEKYTSDAASAAAWAADPAARNADIEELAAVSGHVANDAVNAAAYPLYNNGSGYTRGVMFDATYTVTFLQYYYTDSDFVLYLNGEFYYGDSLPAYSGGTPKPVPTHTPRKTLPPTATPTGTAIATPPTPGNTIVLGKTDTLIPLTPYEQAWKDVSDAYNTIHHVTKGQFLQDTTGQYYYVTADTDIYTAGSPSQAVSNHWELLPITGVIRVPGDFTLNGAECNVKRGDFYTSDNVHYYLCLQDGNVQQPDPSNLNTVKWMLAI